MSGGVMSRGVVNVLEEGGVISGGCPGGEMFGEGNVLIPYLSAYLYTQVCRYMPAYLYNYMERFQWSDVEEENYNLRIIFNTDLHIKEFSVILGRRV